MHLHVRCRPVDCWSVWVYRRKRSVSSTALLWQVSRGDSALFPESRDPLSRPPATMNCGRHTCRGEREWVLLSGEVCSLDNTNHIHYKYDSPHVFDITQRNVDLTSKCLFVLMQIFSGVWVMHTVQQAHKYVVHGIYLYRLSSTGWKSIRSM